MMGFGHMVRGDLPSAIENAAKAVEVARDPYYAQFPRTALGPACVLNGDFSKAKTVLTEAVAFCEENGVGLLSSFCKWFVGVAEIADGEMGPGMTRVKEAHRHIKEYNYLCYFPLFEYVMGYIYYQIAFGPKPDRLVLMKNTGFLIRHAPFAASRAIHHFKKSIDAAKEIAAEGVLGQAYLGLGQVYLEKRKFALAKKNLRQAVEVFEKCRADVYKQQALDALSRIDGE